ncbi:MAG TPA: NAD(P)-binding domain-containing protein [Candidatus Limnocylindrales bacterium]
MQIEVVGTGNVGKALGSSLTRAGHTVTFAAQDVEGTRQVADEVGAAASSSVADGVRTAEVIVLAVPGTAVEDVARQLGNAASGKVVIDVTNPLAPDMSGLANAGGPSNAERLAELLPGAKVVKAFNTLFASAQADPDTHGVKLDALYATDDEDAARTTADLASGMGFRPVRVGPLAAARELEALAWLNIRLQMVAGGDWRTAFVLVGAPSGSQGA